MNLECPTATSFWYYNFTHTTTQSIHFYFRYTEDTDQQYRSNPRPPMSGIIPLYYVTRHMTLCGVVQRRNFILSESIHCTSGSQRRNCRVVLVTGSERTLQYSHCLHPVPRHNKVRRCENKMYGGNLWGVCTQTVRWQMGHEACGIPRNRVLCTITNAT